ncbi:MAG: tyrosine decarboxylase MfnA [Candidatus Altiarchaeales archaeon]|nr:MAG: tyrosine decarboxylase MfnA [Candidatus Altiarchaeales archaeon]RLI93866.1 MAG: tyrosine decarboxylase MfnA [Candidatus Altiarchaeales archaeon]HDO82576.1 tyrosine decarboxylase MfnA [Candidatus Altiarchaeales archaeon]HEX55225.1 tyrosine decarboxylase MfnA [Candidatus Altiarchaeales archaeon]
MERNKIIDELKKLRERDPLFENGRILSSVSTKPPRIALEAFNIFHDTNALDRFLFDSINKLEREIIEWFGILLRNREVSGYITTGGTESNIVALWSAKKIYEGRREIIVPESAHYSIERAADLLELEISWISLDDEFRARVNEIRKKIDKDTLAVIATAGTSALGVIDPIDEINKLCKDVYFHVDAAFGGFVIPFIETKERIDFSLENLDSITIDPHKMGLSIIPSGCILFRNNSYLERLEISPSYLGFKTWTLSGSRTGGTIAATWANIKYLGIDGYKRIVNECIENTKFLCKKLREIEGLEIVVEPTINIVAIRTRDTERLFLELRRRGWKILMDSKTKSIKIVVMPHVTKNVIEKFVNELKEIMRDYE